MKVLIVDDSAQIRTLMKNILAAAWTIDARECGDGRAAVEALGWRPDIVLVDYEMRPMDGVAFTQLLRRGGTPADPRTPVVMMTGHADREHVMAARKAGVDGFIVKPLTIGAVIERVQAALARPREMVHVA
jgi:DNA-binding response OmpR family regulator